MPCIVCGKYTSLTQTIKDKGDVTHFLICKTCRPNWYRCAGCSCCSSDLTQCGGCRNYLCTVCKLKTPIKFGQCGRCYDKSILFLVLKDLNVCEGIMILINKYAELV